MTRNGFPPDETRLTAALLDTVAKVPVLGTASEQMPTAALPASWLARHERLPKQKKAKYDGPLRIALYARYSDEDQSEASIDRQLRHGAKRAAELNACSIKTYVDRAKTGTRIEGRDALVDLTADLEAGLIDVLIAESMERVTRRTIDGVTLFETIKRCACRLDLRGTDQNDDSVAAAARSAERDHSELLGRLHGGRCEAIFAGLVAHQPAFAYDPNPGKPGEHLIVPTLAQAVDEIFTKVSSRIPPETVAATLQGRFPTPGEARAARPRTKRLRKSRTARRARTWDPRPRTWTGGMIRKIVRNPIYRGRIVYNTTTLVRDRKTGRATIYAVDEADWAHSFNERFKIVEPEVWDLANLVLDEGYEARTTASRARFLLDDRALCGACGGRLYIASRTTFRGPTFKCSGAAPDGSACPGVGHHPVARLDRAVLSHIAEYLASFGGFKDFQDAFDAELAASHARLTTARAGLEAQLETHRKLWDCYKRDRALNGHREDDDPDKEPDDELERLVKGEAGRIKDLKEQIALLDVTVRFAALAEADVATLEGGLANLDELLPLSEAGIDGFGFMVTVRRFIKQVRVQSEVEGAVAFSIVLTSRPGAQPEIEAASRRTIEGTFSIDTEAAAEEEDARERIDVGLQAAATSVDDWMPDKAWAIAEPIVEAHRRKKNWTMTTMRELLAAMVFVADKRISWKRLPSTFGKGSAMLKIARSLVASGAWDVIHARWRAECPSVLRGLSPRRLEFRRFRRMQPARHLVLPDADALFAMSLKVEDPEVRARYQAVSLYEKGNRTRAAVAIQYGVEKATFIGWLTKFRAEGPAGLDARVSRCWLVRDQVIALARIVDRNVDPFKPSRPFRPSCLLKYCNEVMGVQYSDIVPIINAMTRAGYPPSDRAKWIPLPDCLTPS